MLKGPSGTCATRRRGRISTRWPTSPFRPAPADQLVGLFDALTSSCQRQGYRGCAFIKAAAEADPHTPIHERTVTHKRRVLEWVRGLAGDAGARNPDALARSLTLLLDGGLASGALHADPAAENAKSAAALLVRAATSPQGFARA